MPPRTTDPFDDAVRTRLERDLASYLCRQRWFGGKAREIAAARFHDWVPLPSTAHPAWIAIAEVMYADGGTERYQLPLAAMRAAAAPADHRNAVLADLAEADVVVCDAVVDDTFCRQILAAILHGVSLRGQRGAVDARPVAQAGREPVDPEIRVVRFPGVHSNSAIAIGGRYLLKLFRRVENGINPDVEIGQFLAQSGAQVQIPALAGTIEYRAADGVPSTLALVQALVASQGNAWEHMLDELVQFFSRARDASATASPARARELAQSSIEAMALLGRRTAELHRALAAPTTNPDFLPERNTPAEVREMTGRISEQAGAALDLLAERLGSLDRELQALSRRVLAHRTLLMERLAALGREIQPFVRIRIHGDYHLGQVLRVEGDFVIIDFEGEPTRPLSERRAKQSPLRDVAGMLRSISYAAHAGLLGASSYDRDAQSRLSPWAHAWERAGADAFLDAYLAVARQAAFMPADTTQLERALELFVLEKALYELNYEMNNRPDWLPAPLVGILALVGAESPR